MFDKQDTGYQQSNRLIYNITGALWTKKETGSMSEGSKYL